MSLTLNKSQDPKAQTEQEIMEYHEAAVFEYSPKSMDALAEIAKEFGKRTKGNENIKDLYIKWSKWDKQIVGNSLFANYITAGYLLKRSAKKDGLLSRYYQFYVRHYTLDFYGARMFIKHSKSDNYAEPTSLEIPFRCIKNLIIPSDDRAKSLLKNSGSKYRFPFIIELQEKDLVLYAMTYMERKMW